MALVDFEVESYYVLQDDRSPPRVQNKHAHTFPEQPTTLVQWSRRRVEEIVKK